MNSFQVWEIGVASLRGGIGLTHVQKDLISGIKFNDAVDCRLLDPCFDNYGGVLGRRVVRTDVSSSIGPPIGPCRTTQGLSMDWWKRILIYYDPDGCRAFSVMKYTGWERQTRLNGTLSQGRRLCHDFGQNDTYECLRPVSQRNIPVIRDLVVFLRLSCVEAIKYMFANGTSP